MITEEEIQTIFRGLLGRQPDKSELEKYKTNLNMDAIILLRNIESSREYKNKFLAKNIPSQVVFFMHIPKTAGTYLRKAWFENNFKNIFWHNGKKENPSFKDLKRDYVEASSYGMIGGHLKINHYLQMKTLQPRIFLAVMREPISRIISFYNYVKYKNLSHPLHAKVMDYSLYELLKSKEDFYQKIHNEQINYLLPREALLEKFSDRDKMIIGKQENLKDFIDASGKLTKIKKSIKEGEYNAGGSGYGEKVKSEQDFDKALQILEDITQKERELYQSIDDVMIMDQAKYREFVYKFTDKEK